MARQAQVRQLPTVTREIGCEARAESQGAGCPIPWSPGALAPSSPSAQREELVNAPPPQAAGWVWLVCFLALLRGSYLSAVLLWGRRKWALGTEHQGFA